MSSKYLLSLLSNDADLELGKCYTDSRTLSQSKSSRQSFYRKFPADGMTAARRVSA